MAINTLKDVREIDGHKVMTDQDRPRLPKYGHIDWCEFDKMREEYPICIDHEKDMISFKMMTKPASEGGKGCQFTTLIETALIMIKNLDLKYTCVESVATIANLESALGWQVHRTTNREIRGVEGFDKA